MASVQEVVQSALLDGSSRVTRRAEIYESDGVTVFANSDQMPRIVDGSVSVQYGSDERRSLDITLDNSDGVLKHDPDGFWYDKIIKVYRGTEWTRKNPQPRILIINAVEDIAPKLRRIGFTDVTTTAVATSVSDLTEYDIIISNAAYSSQTATSLSLCEQAFDTGYSVLSIGNDDNQATLPDFYTGSVAKSDAAQWQVDPASGDNAFKGKWGSLTGLGTDTGNLGTGVQSGVTVVGTFTWSAVARPVAMYKESASGGRWFHMQAYWTSATVLDAFFKLVLKWLDRTADLQSWETQIGEFMVDTITEPRFPRQIKVTGRDYTKKLLKSKFGQALSFADNTDIDTLVRAIAANGGITKMNLDSDGAKLSGELTFDRTTERWAAIRDICASNSIEVFFDHAGYLTTRPLRDPSTSGASMLLATGPTYGNLVDYTKSSNDSRLYNRVIVTSENQNQVAGSTVLQVIVENTEPSSPTRVARIGARDYFYTSSFFTNTTQMRTYGERLLKIIALEEYSLDFTVVPFYWSEAGDIIDFLDPDAGVDEPTRFLLTNFSIPLGLGTMSGTGKRVTIVGQAT